MQSFSTTPTQRQAHLRNEGRERVLHHLKAGHRQAAYEFLLQSVEKQLKCEGVRVNLPRPPLPDPEPETPMAA